MRGVLAFTLCVLALGGGCALQLAAEGTEQHLQAEVAALQALVDSIEPDAGRAPELTTDQVHELIANGFRFAGSPWYEEGWYKVEDGIGATIDGVASAGKW